MSKSFREKWSTFAYDGWDRQVQRTESGNSAVAAGTTDLRYDGLQSALSSERSPTGENVRYTLPSDAESGSGPPLAVARDGSVPLTQFLATDGRGNITTATAAAGGALQCAVRYDPYGTPQNLPGGSSPGAVCSNTGGQTATTVLFAGARRDQSSGTYQLGSRTYDPAKSAFLTPDNYRTGHSTADLSVGVDPLTRNTYSYVNGDPVNLTDPTGHRPEEFGAGCDSSHSCGQQALDRQQAGRSFTGKQDLTCRTCSNGNPRANARGNKHDWQYNAGGGLGKAGWAALPGLVSDLARISPFSSDQALARKLDSWEASLSAWYDADLDSDAYRNGNYTGQALGFVSAAGVGIKLGTKAVKAGANAIRRTAPAPAAGAGAGSGAASTASGTAAAGSRAAEGAAATSRGGMAKSGAIFSSEKNAAGGTVWTSDGTIVQDDFASIVQSGSMRGEVNILSGVHGDLDAAGALSMRVDRSLYAADVRRFGRSPGDGMNVHHLPDLTPAQISELLNGPGTTIGGFCHSGACLAPFK